MPGIVGIIRKTPGEQNENDLGLMIDSMMHEPFYSKGTYINRQLGLYAGWVCHEGSFSDCMPVVNERQDLVLLFSGENFVDHEVTDGLRRRGHEFEDSNASYLIHLYEEDEDRFLERLNGWFSGIIVDLRRKKLVLFNDRYGMHRIYYYEGKDAFLFSSEAKALLKIRPILRNLDLQSLGEFFTWDCVLENRSLFSNVFLLPGGSAWTFGNASSISKNYYFKPSEWENQSVLGKEVFYNRLRKTFLDILPRYFSANQPIAMSLTSGLDTRMIMSCLDSAPGQLPCYTFTGMYGDTLDARIARKVANACHQTHQTVGLDGQFFSDFSNLAEKTIYITDGCHDVWGSHDIYFNTAAREIAPIRMTGKFGSEILGNMSMLRRTLKHSDNLFRPHFKKYIDKAVKTLEDIKKGHRLTFSVFKETPRYQYGCLAMESSKLTLRTPYMDNDLVKLMYQSPAYTRATKEIRLRLIQDNNPALHKIMTDRGTAGESSYFFSKCAQLFYYTLFKLEYVYLYQLRYWIPKLDKFFAPMHPGRLILRRYQYIQPRIWFRDELSSYVRAILLDNRSTNRQYLNRGSLEKMVNEHVKGTRNYVNEINKVMTAELIYRLLIEDI